jgi:hypothetical protein
MTWILSILTILTLWFVGNKSIWGPIIGFVSQIIWIVYIALTVQWGLLPMEIVLLIVYVRMFFLWRAKSSHLFFVPKDGA